MINQFCILIHYHEISLKGKNRSWFERRLIRNIKQQLIGLSVSRVHLTAARIFCFGINEFQWDEYAKRLKKVMGIKHATLVNQIENNIEQIQESVSNQLQGIKFDTFRVTTKRQHKDFPLTSQQVNEKVGKEIQSLFLKQVDLKNAELNMIIELVKGMAYIGYKRVQGYGGLPVGTSEKAVSMISSGIDSPVASFEMLQRGVDLSYVHFHSNPATSRQSIQNVEEILMVLAGYQIQCQVYMVPLLKIQQKIMAEAPNKLWVILFRRAMIRIASMIANEIDAPALISGESVGQVASQTLSNIRATGDVADRPILRPLCGMNKEDIVNLARGIGTYEISIEPYEDCCSFFVPIHPETKADITNVIKIESSIHFGDLYDDAMRNTIISTIQHPDYNKGEYKILEEVDD